MQLSCYILTLNSARRLRQVLESLKGIADDLVVVDSGSTDETTAIAQSFGARIIYRPLDDFTTQRSFAVSQCSHNWILFVDSDEVVSSVLRARLHALKQTIGDELGDGPDAFAITREWYVLGQRVHCVYPSTCPDSPIRLFHKSREGYRADRRVHEAMHGFKNPQHIPEPLLHYTCDSVTDLYGKLRLYAALAALELRAKRGRPSYPELLVMPLVIAMKWYFFQGGWRDGLIGILLARYAFDTVYLKYLIAKLDDDQH